jgi:hypothetical protein
LGSGIPETFICQRIFFSHFSRSVFLMSFRTASGDSAFTFHPVSCKPLENPVAGNPSDGFLSGNYSTRIMAGYSHVYPGLFGSWFQHGLGTTDSVSPCCSGIGSPTPMHLLGKSSYRKDHTEPLKLSQSSRGVYQSESVVSLIPALFSREVWMDHGGNLFPFYL